MILIAALAMIGAMSSAQKFSFTGRYPIKVEERTISGEKVDQWNSVYTDVNTNDVDIDAVFVKRSDSAYAKPGSYVTRYDFKTEPTRHEYIKVLNMLGAGIKLTPVMPSGGSFVGSSNQMIDQRASYILAYVQDTVSVSSIQYQMNSAGSYTVDGTEFNGIAIYSTSGTTATRIAITANTATAWTQAANTVATLNLTAPVTLYPGLYYVGFLYNYLVQTTAPYIVGLQPGAIYTGTVLSNSMSLGIFYSSVTQFPASFTISSTQQLGILHNFIGK